MGASWASFYPASDRFANRPRRPSLGQLRRAATCRTGAAAERVLTRNATTFQRLDHTLVGTKILASAVQSAGSRLGPTRPEAASEDGVKSHAVCPVSQN